jgi:hypothetical protein
MPTWFTSFEEFKPKKKSGLTISSLLNELFARFNFTVAESTPLDVEVAVDPEMLGKVFEELVTGRHETGSYYTPKTTVSYMSRIPGLRSRAICPAKFLMNSGKLSKSS